MRPLSDSSLGRVWKGETLPHSECPALRGVSLPNGDPPV